MRYRAIIPAFLVGAVVTLTGCPGDRTDDTVPPATETTPPATDPTLQPGMTDPATTPGMTADTPWVTGTDTPGAAGAPRP